jgi:8-oxo-dGTP pyrophosphatase MutT (NUDIX family)
MAMVRGVNIEVLVPRDEGPDTPIKYAASIVLLRDGANGVEILMLKRPEGGNFGGFWVFPGGKVDAADRLGVRNDDALGAFRNAARREAVEECGIEITGDSAALSYWEPPARAGARFGTWFFVAEAPHSDVVIDGSEIVEYEWVSAAEGHARRDAGGFELAPPTWMTLHTLKPFDTVADAVAHIATQNPIPEYYTRMGRIEGGLVAMWAGDAGYHDGDSERPGPRHRLNLRAEFSFEQD